MSKKRDEFEERMDVLATETTKLEARLLRLGAEIAHQEIWDLGTLAVAAAHHLDLARVALTRPRGTNSGGGTGQHSPDPIEGGGLRPL
jgi:hypothetical protein